MSEAHYTYIRRRNHQALINKMNREDLEHIALETVSAELYYDLADTIDSVGDDELRAIIACNGDYEKELAISGE